MTDAYKKAYDRERNARLAAEKLLDEKTREVQSSIDMIQHQFNDLMKQKKESDYLLAVARLSKNEDDLTAVVSGYLDASIQYIGAQVGRYSYLRGKKLKVSNAVGCDENIPTLTAESYQQLYKMEGRKMIEVSALKSPELEAHLSKLGINRVGIIPIKCFGKVTTVCEIYFPEDVEFDTDILNQCEVSSYQIGSILEGAENKKKLESSYVEIKSSHGKLQEAQSQLVQSEKMASLGQLAAGVAHEINNPIGFVMSNVGTLKEYSEVISNYIQLSSDLIKDHAGPKVDAIKALDDDEDLNFIVKDINEIMKDCSDGLRRVKEIVANLKSFARSDDEESSEFDINECIENTVKVVWNELKYKVTLDKDLAQGLPAIKGHEGQIGQVVMNMLVNGAHAIDERGEINITTQLSGDSVLVKIKDTGKGMSKKVMSKIFDPFFTTKGVSEGTGLGLSISYGIVESHGGHISVNSKEGEGTEFVISIPVDAPPPAK